MACARLAGGVRPVAPRTGPALSGPEHLSLGILTAVAAVAALRGLLRSSLGERPVLRLPHEPRLSLIHISEPTRRS
eukprot:3951093-Prymnesium_polylepis.2